MSVLCGREGKGRESVRVAFTSDTYIELKMVADMLIMYTRKLLTKDVIFH